MKRLLNIVLAFCVSSTAFSQANVNAIEYYFDVDPGYGNGTPITITPAPLIDISTTLNLTGLTPGLHFAYIRALNDSGWSETFIQPFMCQENSATAATASVIGLEYFVDSDPGFGNGTPITVTPSAVLDITDNIALGGYATGMHILHLRALDANGMWSFAYSIPFLVVSGTPNPNMISIEYFVDTDPGFGNATSLTFTTQNPVATETFNIDLSSINSGLHILHVRTKDANNNWSLAYARPFLVNGNGAVEQVAAIEYFFDIDPGYGNGISLAVTASTTLDINDNLDLNGLADGLHILHIRALTASGDWSLNYTKPFIMIGGYSNPNIVALEFHIDTITGLGQGTPILLNANTVIDTTVIVDLTTTIEGTHHLYIAAQDANGAWSMMYDKLFCVGALAQFASDTVCFGMPSIIYNNSPSDTTLTAFDWDVNNDSITDFTAKDTIQYIFPGVGSYPVTLIVDKDSLCPDTFTTNVIVDSLGSISGNIFNSSGAVTAGFVKLYEVSSGAYIQYDSIGINGSGNYYFINVEPNQYVLKVSPDTTMYPNTVATYFDSTYHWANAETIISFCDTSIDIGLLDLSLVFGDGTVSGTVNWIDTTGQRAGDPIPGLDISLEQIPGGIIANNTQTDDNGKYQFENLPDATYQIYVDIPGAPMDSTYTITIDSDDTLYTDLNFIFDSASIYIAPVTGTSIASANQLDYSVAVFPNPFNQYFTVVLDIPTDANVSINLVNVLGEEIRTVHQSNLPTGTYSFDVQLDANNISTGIYFVKVKVEGSPTNTIRLVKTN